MIEPMHKYVAYFAYGFLAFTGTMHFVIDVVSQYVRGVRPPGPEATLYYGLNISFALGQVVLGAIGLWLARRDLNALRQAPFVVISLLAAVAWLAITFFFIEYWPPRINAAVFLAATIAASMLSRPAPTTDG